VKPTLIANGAKNMYIEVPGCRVRMIDSINFLPSALSELPKIFGLEELKKGYFPHLFNSKENQSVVLNHIPDVHYYNHRRCDMGQFCMWSKARVIISPSLPATGTILSKGTWVSPTILGSIKGQYRYREWCPWLTSDTYGAL
jgi:hypothetical protein